MAKQDLNNKSVIRLHVADPTATVPAGIAGNGTVMLGGVKAKLHAMFAPRERKGALLVEIGSNVEGWMDSHRNDCPNPEAQKQIPIADAIAKMNEIKSHFGDVKPANIVGKWEASIVLGGKFPSILLVRKMNYAVIAVSSEANGKWAVSAARDKRWFKGAEAVEKQGFASMESAIAEGMTMVDSVIASACVAQNKVRRAAEDPAYAAKIAAKREAKGKGDVPATIGIAEAKAIAKDKAKLAALKTTLGGKIGAVIGTQRKIIKPHPNAGFVGKVIGAATHTLDGKPYAVLTLTKGEEVYTVPAKQTRKPKAAKPKAEGETAIETKTKGGKGGKGKGKGEKTAAPAEKKTDGRKAAGRERKIKNMMAKSGITRAQAEALLGTGGAKLKGSGKGSGKGGKAPASAPTVAMVDQSAGF